MSVSHGGVSDEAFPRRHRNKRYGWVVITPELNLQTLCHPCNSRKWAHYP